MAALVKEDQIRKRRQYRDAIRPMVVKQAIVFVVVLLVFQQMLNAGGPQWKASVVADLVTATVAAIIGAFVLYRVAVGSFKQYTTAVSQLEVAEIDIVERLAKAAEFRDDATGGHVQRMSNYCGLLAKLANFSERDVDLLILASQMHDIGKIGIPDQILLKEGKLTPEERLIIESHVDIGAKVLKHGDTPLVQMAYEVVLTHHEKWDGTGYPNRLKGLEIPITGRIAALCDVFEALTCSRPYKRAWSFHEATREIAQQSGRHFDPQLVDIFMNNLDQFKEMYDRHLPDTEPWKAVVTVEQTDVPARVAENKLNETLVLHDFSDKAHAIEY
ncbi:MAG: HD domain-containing protein [Fimbriimonadaceae bacterium]|nr:HD domain-containing protein [Fimbriimonadaceae bacterium]